MKVKSFISNHLIPFKIIAAVIAFAMIAMLLWFANDLLGNPISYSLAKKSAEKYVAENYADKGYIVDGVGYSFKFGWYIASVGIPGSEDCRFTVTIGTNGNIGWDNYESLVLNGFNVSQRMEMSYRELTNSIFESPAYPYSSYIAYGSLIFEKDDIKDKRYDFGLPKDILIPDTLFNVAELGEKGGLLTIYVDAEEEATPEKAAEVLLEIDSLMEQGGAPFYAVDLTLRSSDGGYILENFHRSDIHEDGLVERIKNIGLTIDEYNASMTS